MKKLNYITILSITAGLISVSAMNAVAEDYWNPTEGGGAWITQPDGSFGIYNTAYDWSHSQWDNSRVNPDTGTQGSNVVPTKGAWQWGGALGSDSKITTFKAIADQSVLSFEIERNNTSKGFTFGTYTYGSDGPTRSEALGTVGAGNSEDSNKITFANGASDTTAYSGAFDTNEIVGIWVKDNANGMLYYSDYDFDTGHAGGQHTDGQLDDNTGVSSLYFDLADRTWPEDPFNNSDVKIRITGAAPGMAGYVPVTPAGGSSGSPLPGVWATIALAGAASAYLKRRRKENK